MLVRTLLLIPALCICAVPAVTQDTDYVALADGLLGDFDHLPDSDADGYGELAWGVSYGMVALNVLYEATGDVRYLERQAAAVEDVLLRRDSDLAAAHGEEPYRDFQRGRVLHAWGTGHYTDGRHTCWLVHAGMLLYPMAEYVRLVRSGGERTSALAARADRIVPLLEEVIAEFADDWREGLQLGMGYYLLAGGALCPNNQMNAPARALFILGELTGKADYTEKATKVARFFKSKLTHVADGDYYLWSYSQGTPDGAPGRGEDVSHAALNADFAYVAWERGVAFTDEDMARLARTVTRGLYQGNGNLAAALGDTQPNDGLTSQIGRWAFLARFDPEVERVINEYTAAHPESGAFHGTTGALGYAYLARSRLLRAGK